MNVNKDQDCYQMEREDILEVFTTCPESRSNSSSSNIVRDRIEMLTDRKTRSARLIEPVRDNLPRTNLEDFDFVQRRELKMDKNKTLEKLICLRCKKIVDNVQELIDF